MTTPVAHIDPRHGHRIVCAAVKLANGVVVCGVRHLDALMHAQIAGMDHHMAEVMHGHEQGFVDNKYDFLSRADAYKVALAAFQFDPASPEYTGIRGSLFSEDLW